MRVKKNTAQKYVSMQQLPEAVLEKLDGNVWRQRKVPSSNTCSTIASVLVDRSTAEPNMVIDSMRTKPDLVDTRAIVAATEEAIANHALEVAVVT